MGHARLCCCCCRGIGLCGTSSALRRYRGGRQFRQRAACHHTGCPAAPGLTHQDHDAVSAVRAARGRQAPARQPTRGLGGSRCSDADQARIAGQQHHSSRGCDQGDRDAIGKRRLGRCGGGDRRRRGRIRQADDAQGAGARDDPYRLQERFRPSGRRPGDHGARSIHPRAGHSGALSELLQVFFDPLFHLSRAADRQPQPSSWKRRRRRWYQDRLHPRFRFQSGDLGAAGRSPLGCSRHGRQQRRQPRRKDARADQREDCRGLHQADRPADRCCRRTSPTRRARSRRRPSRASPLPAQPACLYARHRLRQRRRDRSSKLPQPLPSSVSRPARPSRSARCW